VANPKITRAQLELLDAEALLLDERFLRFLSTIRIKAGIETTAYGPAEHHLHFKEGRRSLWCDILRTVEQCSDDALLRILTAEMNASKETSDGRRKQYDRLGTDDGSTRSGASGPEPASGPDFLDYGKPAG
jgi:hypothetical protein